MRRALRFAVPGLVLILLARGLHLFIQRQLGTAAPPPAPSPTEAPAQVPVPSETPIPTATVVPTTAPTAAPTASVPPKPTSPPQPTSTPAPPPTATPTPGPIVTNDKLGVGVYTPGLPVPALRTLRPAMLLMEDPDPRAVSDLRAIFPKALIVGRHYVPDGDRSLANCSDPNEDHTAKGIAFADNLARTAVPLRQIVDAWVSDNEQTSHDRPQDYPCHAAFQVGFIETMQDKYHIAAVAGNDAAGAIEPSDYPKYFAKPISMATYFGIHAYGKPESRRLNNGPESQYYALRYRTIHDELVQARVPLPKGLSDRGGGGFLLTETGVYEGYRGMVDDTNMANDFIWLEQQTEQDRYVTGQFVFGIGTQGTRFGPYEIMGTSVIDVLGQFNAQHAGTP